MNYHIFLIILKSTLTELNSDLQAVIFDDAWANSEIMFNVLFSLIFMKLQSQSPSKPS